MLSAFYAFHSSLEILVLCGKWYSMCSPFLCIAYYCLISISLIKFWIFSLNYITATHFKYPENCNMLKLLLFHVLCLWLPIYVNFLYCRNIQFFGMDSQKKVTESYVVVIGLGGGWQSCSFNAPEIWCRKVAPCGFWSGMDLSVTEVGAWRSYEILNALWLCLII